MTALEQPDGMKRKMLAFNNDEYSEQQATISEKALALTNLIQWV